MCRRLGETNLGKPGAGEFNLCVQPPGTWRNKSEIFFSLGPVVPEAWMLCVPVFSFGSLPTGGVHRCGVDKRG